MQALFASMQTYLLNTVAETVGSGQQHHDKGSRMAGTPAAGGATRQLSMPQLEMAAGAGRLRGTAEPGPCSVQEDCLQLNPRDCYAKEMMVPNRKTGQYGPELVMSGCGTSHTRLCMAYITFHSCCVLCKYTNLKVKAPGLGCTAGNMVG
jgi:hypothetical protein